MKTWICMRVPDKYWEEFAKELVEEEEYPTLTVGVIEIIGCSTSKDGKNQYIQAKPKHIDRG